MPQERTDHTGFHANSGCYYNYQISIRCLLDPLYSARKPGRGFYREAQKKGHSPFQIWKGVLVPLTSEFTYQETSLNLIRGNETFQRPMYDTPETPLEAMNPAMKYTNSKGDRNSYPPLTNWKNSTYSILMPMMFSHNSSIFAVTLFFLPLHYINAMYTSQDYGKLGPMNIAEINKSQNLDLELSLQPSLGKETETMHAIQGEIDTADARNVPNPIQSGITVTNVGKKRKIKLFCKECDVIPDMPFVVFEPLERYHPWAGVGSDKKIKGLSLVVSITTSQTPPIRFKLPIFGRH